MYERLDRGVCSVEWKLQFPQSQVRHEPFINLDHEALVIDIQPNDTRHSKPPRRFRFENAWLQLEGCVEVIRSTWNLPQSGYPMFQVCQKIKACRFALLNWSNSRTRPSKHQIDQVRAVVAEIESNCQENPRDIAAAINRQNARKSLNDLLAMEESYWKIGRAHV